MPLILNYKSDMVKIVLIGGHGTIGKKVAAVLSPRHELIIAGRSSGDIQVYITDPASIEKMFRQLKTVDACICTAGTGYYGDFQTMEQHHMMDEITGKLMRQVNLVLIGKQYLIEGGSLD
jgi:NAD dependent epimerase/dehydratase family enzyme